MYRQRSDGGRERVLGWRPYRSHREDFSFEEESENLVGQKAAERRNDHGYSTSQK
jgi:hypothetical protein